MEDSFSRDSGRGNGLGDDSRAWHLLCTLFLLLLHQLHLRSPGIRSRRLGTLVLGEHNLTGNCHFKSISSCSGC